MASSHEYSIPIPIDENSFAKYEVPMSDNPEYHSSPAQQCNYRLFCDASKLSTRPSVSASNAANDSNKATETCWGFEGADDPSTQEPPMILSWLKQHGVSDAIVDIVCLMGLSRPIDFLMFTDEELTLVYNMNASDVQRIKVMAKDYRSQEDSKPPPMRKCVAVHNFVAVEETHLSAKIDDVFRIINSSFAWWLCRDTNGNTGLLPSNHLKEIQNDNDIGSSMSAIPNNTKTSVYEEVEPKWMLRERIKQIVSDALMSDDMNDHFITYHAVKTLLIGEFGEELYKADVEHVKEQIRRAEELCREKHNAAAVAANIALKQAYKHRYRASIKRRKREAKEQSKAAKAALKENAKKPDDDAPSVIRHPDSDPDDLNEALPLMEGGTSSPDLDQFKIADQKLLTHIEKVGAQGFGHLPCVPVLPPRNYNQRSATVSDRVTHSASAPSGRNVIKQNAKQEDGRFMMFGNSSERVTKKGSGESAAWLGGLLDKKGDPNRSMGINFSSSTKTRWFEPCAVGLRYYTDQSRSELKGDIEVDNLTQIHFPPSRPMSVLITPSTTQRTYDLTAKSKQCFVGLRDYLHHKLFAPRLVKGTAVERGKSLESGYFGTSCVATWENRKVVKKLLKRPLPPGYTEDKFQSEVSLKATIGGHRCLGILGCGIEANQAFILQEYGENLSLSHRLFSGEKITVEEKLDILSTIHNALLFLHAKFRRPHLRLHNNNVIVTEHNILKIGEFGFTDILSRKSNDTKMGSDEYVNDKFCQAATEDISKNQFIFSAPEWWEPAPSLPADVYSFAMVAFEVLTLKPANSHVHVPTTVSEYHRLGERPKIEAGGDISEEMVNLLKDCWVAEPSLRPTFPKMSNYFKSLVNAKK